MAHALAKVEGVGSRKDTVTFDARAIKIVPTFNPRSAAELKKNVETLKPQILAYGGILKHVWVYKDGPDVKLLDGESRLTAFLELLAEGKLDNPFIKVELFAGMGDESARVMMAITANGGKPLEKWELGAAYARLVNVGSTKETIAVKLGVSLRHVTEAITLSETPLEMRNMLSAGIVTTGAVLAEVKAVGATQAAANLTQAAATSGGVPVKRARAVSQAELIAAASQLIDEALPDQESPAYMSVTIEAFQALKAALKGSV